MKQFAVALAIIAGIMFAGFHPLPADASTGRQWAPCANDEFVPGIKCVWDARHMGNGSGRSFFTNAEGVHFISHARAHRMLHR